MTGDGVQRFCGLVERQDELELLGSVIGSARGSLVLIEGRPGLGKSVLADAAVVLADRRDVGVRAVRARDIDVEVPWSLIARLVGTPVGDLDAAVAALFAERPCLVVVDDAHRADPCSLEALRHLAGRLDELPIALVVTTRVGEWPPEDPVLDQLRVAPQATVLVLRPLSVQGVATLTAGDDSAGDPEALTAWTAGIPSLLSQVLAVGGGPGVLPEPVTRAIGSRLRRLPTDAVALARALAVVGRPAPLRLVADLAGLDRPAAERAADVLARFALLTPGDPIEFVAPVECAAVLAGVEPFARARDHRAVARHLAADGADVAEIADHLLHTSADGDSEVVEVLREAGTQALDAGDPESAAGYFKRALAEPPTPEARDAIVLSLATAELFCGTPSAAHRIERILDRVPNGGPRAEALRQLGTLQFLRNDPSAAAATLKGALEHAGNGTPLAEALLGEYLAAATFAPDLRADADRRFGAVMGAIAAGEPLPTDAGLLVQVINAMALGGGPRSLVMDVVGRLLRENPTWSGPPFGLFADWIAAASIWVDDVDLAVRVATRSNRAAHDAGDVVRQCLTSYWIGLAQLHQGELDSAAARLQAALTRQDSGWTSAVAWSAAALCLTELARGDLPAAAAALDRARDVDPDAFHTGVLLEARGRLAFARGRPDRALEDFLAAGRHMESTYQMTAPTMIAWRSDAAFALCATGGNLRQARKLADDELDVARQIDAPRHLARALRAAAAARGACPDALALLQEAAALMSATTPRLEALHVMTDLGRQQIADGELSDARSGLLKALERATAAGAVPLAAQIRRHLRAAGIRPRSAQQRGPGALTAAERRVVDLAAAGLSNHDIADTLTVSARTVESHLYSAYLKLGVKRRTDLKWALE